jgi:hypothetical protein
MSSMRTVGTFLKRGTCSQTLLSIVNRAYSYPLPGEEKAADPLAGGIMQHGYQCGLIWGASLAAGAEAYRRFGAGPRGEAAAILAARRLVDSFRTQNQHTNCVELTGLDASSTTLDMVTHFFLKGGTVDCCRMAARYAPLAFDEIEATLSGQHDHGSAPTVSCAAELARAMGASELQVGMAAGLAGGIGLSGGGCGALGAAIWLVGIRTLERGGRVAFKSDEARDVIERFLKVTDFELECSAIVGRTFESVAAHAEHLQQGGCARVLAALAGTASAQAAGPAHARAGAM